MKIKAIIFFLLLLLPSSIAYSDSLTVSGLTISGLSINADISVTAPKRIMPLGDSITRGVSGSTDSLGYRNNLQVSLGVGVYDFVGSQTDPNSDATYDVDHEGVGGETTAEIELRTQTALTNYLTTNNQNSYVFLIAGTNDMLDSLATATAVDNVEDIIDLIHNHDSNITVFVALIPPNTNGTEDAKITTYNSALLTRLQTIQGVYDNIIIVDLNAAFKNDTFGICATVSSCMNADGIHPNDTGYDNISRQFYSCFTSSVNTNCNGN